MYLVNIHLKMGNGYPDDWRKVMLAQYSIFGSVAGLEVTALTIFATLTSQGSTLAEKVIFSITCGFLFFDIILILWLINQERRVAANDSIPSFQENERVYRSTLIVIMIVTWGLLLTLLLLKIWS